MSTQRVRNLVAFATPVKDLEPNTAPVVELLYGPGVPESECVLSISDIV